MVNHLVYDALGRVTSETDPPLHSRSKVSLRVRRLKETYDRSPLGFAFLFTARPFDPDTQLQNNLNRWYDARVGRWLSEDPVGFRDRPNLYQYVADSPLNSLDPFGLLKVCCRAVNMPWPYNIFRHCEIRESCSEDEQSFDIWKDDSPYRKMDNGTPCKCATEDDIAKCLQRHPYSDHPRGPHNHWWDWIGNNCQTSTLLTIGHCCLKSTWRPNWYAGHPLGRCLKGHYETAAPSPAGPVMFFVCDQWELPEWRGDRPPVQR